MDNLKELIETEFLSNSTGQWLLFVALFTVVYFGLLIIRSFVSGRIQKEHVREPMKVLGQLFAKLKKLYVFILALFIGLKVSRLSIGENVPADMAFMTKLVAIATYLQIGLFAIAGLTLWLQRYRDKKLQEEDMARISVINFVEIGCRMLIGITILLLILDNLGQDITALVAGLGVGGLAVALAVQSILGDLFASLTIVLDKPFVVGDFIMVDPYLGTVEKVGLKTTHIRSLSGEQLVFSNADLLGSRIRNYKRMNERRVVFHIGVTYQTPHHQIKAIPDMIKAIVSQEEKARLDRCHFQKYGDFALIYETVYWIETPDYVEYMDIQERINLAIHEKFEQENIEFAYPTRTIFLNREANQSFPHQPQPKPQSPNSEPKA